MSGAIILEPRPVHNFDEVYLKGYGDLVIEQGETEALVVEAEEDLLPRILTEVRGNRLIISYKPGFQIEFQTRPIIYHLSMKTIHAIDISGSGTMETNRLHTDTLRLGVSGSATMEVDDLQAHLLNLNISGSGKIDLTGKVEKQDIQVSGSGEVQAWGLETQEARLEVSGSASVTVRVVSDLNISASGIATIEYFGQPSLHQRISGVVNLRNIG